jgi:diguanylate cyclase (GGDEF)-like protein
VAEDIGRAEVQVAEERRRATRSGEIAARHEDLAANGPPAMREFHQTAAEANRRLQERHLVSAGIHAAHVTRLRAAARTASRTSLPEDAVGGPNEQQGGLDDARTTDQLTGLPSRRLFAERLAVALESDTAGRRRRLAVCLVDLDFFGAINDRFGRTQADRVLVTVAERLVACAPARLVARLGGDEFVVLLEDLASWEEASALASALVEAIAEPITVGSDRVSVSASIGVARRDAAETNAAELLRSARVSLRWAKEGGRRRWEVFDPERDKKATELSALAADLPAAIERDEFIVDYQPVVSLADGRTVGAEALVRWKHPALGVLGPDRFIELAEERGLIGRIGEIVLARACGEAARWRQLTSTPIFISVNVAVRQLEDPDLVRQVSTVLDETGLPASDLHLEILEGAIIRSSSRSVPALHRLADLGIAIAIDDFGTGYSNLSYLRRLPVKIIKTDRSFITDLCPPDRGPDDAGTEIFSTIVSLAHVLGLTVTAEGVETETQAEWLRSMGVEAGQGWHLGKPMAPGQFRTVIASAGRRAAEPDGGPS